MAESSPFLLTTNIEDNTNHNLDTGGKLYNLRRNIIIHFTSQNNSVSAGQTCSGSMTSVRPSGAWRSFTREKKKV